MKYLPYDNITYITQLNPQEVLQRLQNNIEQPGVIRPWKAFGNTNFSPYTGVIHEQGFTIKRVISYRNSFLPTIKGQVYINDDDCRIKVKMGLHPFVMVFIFLFFSGAIFGFLALVLSSLLRNKFESFLLIPLGMAVFIFLLSTIAFKYESNISKKFLAKLWEAKIEKQ